MDKIKLNVEDLSVESFRTVDDGDGTSGGTVLGRADSCTACPTLGSPCPDMTDQFSCVYVCSLDSGCGGTCFNTCPQSCMSCGGGFSCDSCAC